MSSDHSQSNKLNGSKERNKDRNKSNPADIEVDERGDKVDTTERGILDVFGKPVNVERQPAAEVLPELAVLWDDVIKKGLPEEVLKDILKKYLLPSNCKFFDPPTVNNIVKTVMPKVVLERDERIRKRQEKLSASLSAVAKIVQDLAKEEEIEKFKGALEQLGDLSKLVADLQHDENVIRRNLFIANVSTEMKKTLQLTDTDDLLFGKGLEESIKSAKAIKSASQDLKYQRKGQPTNKSAKNEKTPFRPRPFREQHLVKSGTKSYYSSSQNPKRSNQGRYRQKRTRTSRYKN